MAKSKLILVEDYTVLSATEIQLNDYTSAQQIQLAYVFNVTQKKLYYAPTEKYAVGTLVNGLITIPTATMLVTDIIHVQIWDNVALDEAYDSNKVLIQNPTVNNNVIDSLLDAVGLTCTTAATFDVTVTRGVVTSAALVSEGKDYPASLTASLFLGLEFNSGIGAVLTCSTDSSGVVTAITAVRHTGYGYTASANPVTGYIWEAFPSETGIVIDGFKDMSLTGRIPISTSPNLTKIYVEASNDEDNTATNAEWVRVVGADVSNGTMVKEVLSSTMDLLFGLDFENLNFKYFRVILLHELSLPSTNPYPTIKMRRNY